MNEGKVQKISRGASAKRIAQYWFRCFRANGAQVEMPYCVQMATAETLYSWATK